MSNVARIVISKEQLHKAAELARQCSSTSVRERVLVSQAVALAVRKYLEQFPEIETADGRSALLKYVELLDIADFQSRCFHVEVRAVTNVEQMALYVPTMPLMVGLLSDLYICAQVNSSLTEAVIYGYAEREDLGNADLSTNGLFAILPIEDLKPIEKLPEQLGHAAQVVQAMLLDETDWGYRLDGEVPESDRTNRPKLTYDEWQARTDRIIAAVSELIGSGEIFRRADHDETAGAQRQEPLLGFKGILKQEEIKQIAEGLRDNIMRVFGEQLPATGLEPLFKQLFRRFSLEKPVPAKLGSPVAFKNSFDARTRFQNPKVREEFFNDDLGVGERVALYRYLLEEEVALEEHRKKRRILDTATGGKHLASPRRRDRIKAVKERMTRAAEISADMDDLNNGEADWLNGKKESTMVQPQKEQQTGQGQFTLEPGQIITGPLFNEPMRVETVRASGPDTLVVGLVGTQSEKFRSVTLTSADLLTLKIQSVGCTYTGDGNLLRLGLQAYSFGIAYEFDPYFGLSISRVDPLPHQLEAVYDHMLKLARIRFLLADDAGAGKTIMAGLLIRELKLRGLAERILILCPANLSFQWQRELNEKFQEKKFVVLKGDDIRDQFGMNQWLEQKHVIASLDLAKKPDILPGLGQVHWDLVIVDEAHRMSWTPPSKKTARYALGELLRERSDHMLLLTATPHKGDPRNFSLFLQLLDNDVYADVRSIREAMDRRRAPFYLRRTKEAMVYFPEPQPDGSWAAKKIFKKRIPKTVDFQMDGDEFELYRAVTRFVKQQSAKAAAQGDDPRARAVGFLMALYQRRLASSTYAMRHSLENRAKRLEEGLRQAEKLARNAPPDLPTQEELEEMEENKREQLERMLEAITLAGNAEQIREEVQELKQLAAQAQAVEDSGKEAKLSRLESLLRQQGFFDQPEKRLLIFTEFKDTLDYLMKCLKKWGFRVGCIHGQMKPGFRDEPGARLYAEQQFKDGEIQVLVATEAAGEGINLQCCHILFNYDIPWNPNRLEQRMGRIHRYGQLHDCLIFNFVATNTIEGYVLQQLLVKLQEIRDALDDDAVFNVVGEVLSAAHIERVLRDYYAGRLGDGDLEEQLLKDVDEKQFRNICQSALEGLATKKLNLAMLIERRALAQERRMVPETIARFIRESAGYVPLTLKPIQSLHHTFEPSKTPLALRRYETQPDWNLPALADRYSRFSTDRETAEKNNLEWVTPGHSLFEALRRYTLSQAQDIFTKGACFYSLQYDTPARLDFYRARVVDGMGKVIHERLFVLEITDKDHVRSQEPSVLGNCTPVQSPGELPPVASLPEATEWLSQNVLTPFLEDVRKERTAEVDRIADHVELSLTELLKRADEEIGRAAEEVEQKVPGSEGRFAQAEEKHSKLMARRKERSEELARQRALSLQSVERIASAIILPHPERESPEIQRLRQNSETEATAMRVAMEYERAQGRQVYDVHEKDLGYDLTSLDLNSGELRLIEVKGIGAASGTVLLTPNEKRVAEDRRDCYWLYVVTNCNAEPKLHEPIRDPARFEWHEVKKVEHYYLSVEAMK